MKKISREKNLFKNNDFIKKNLFYFVRKMIGFP